MPFPLQESDKEITPILQDLSHLAHRKVSRQHSARKLYANKFRDTEAKLRKQGGAPGSPIANFLNNPAWRIYTCFTKLGRMPMSDESFVHEMVRLGFDLDAKGIERYL